MQICSLLLHSVVFVHSNTTGLQHVHVRRRDDFLWVRVTCCALQTKVSFLVLVVPLIKPLLTKLVQLGWLHVDIVPLPFLLVYGPWFCLVQEHAKNKPEWYMYMMEDDLMLDPYNYSVCAYGSGHWQLIYPDILWQRNKERKKEKEREKKGKDEKENIQVYSQLSYT